MATTRERLDWIEHVDALLMRAEMLTGSARAADAPLGQRVGLWVEISAVRRQLAHERALLLAAAAD